MHTAVGIAPKKCAKNVGDCRIGDVDHRSAMTPYMEEGSL